MARVEQHGSLFMQDHFSRKSIALEPTCTFFKTPLLAIRPVVYITRAKATLPVPTPVWRKKPSSVQGTVASETT